MIGGHTYRRHVRSITIKDTKKIGVQDCWWTTSQTLVVLQSEEKLTLQIQIIELFTKFTEGRKFITSLVCNDLRSFFLRSIAWA